MAQSKEQFTQMRDEEQQQAVASKTPSQKQADIIITHKTFLDIDKEGIRDFSMQVVDWCQSGYGSPTDALIFAKKLTDTADLIKENLADSAATELRLAKGEKRELHNTVINEQMVGTRYDYASTGDKVWERLNQAVKEREKFLQGVKGTISVNDEETGEVMEIREPVKTGKMALIIKVK